MDDVKSLSHSKWRCKYHIVFAPKFRRKEIYGKKKAEIGKILRMLWERKGVRVIEAECCPDHVHMLVEIPPHLSVSAFVGYLKSKSSLMIFERFANLKYKYGNRHFWCRGYYVDTVGKYEGTIRDYIKNQLTKVWLQTFSMYLSTCDHRRKALIGPGQTTSSTGGFDFF